MASERFPINPGPDELEELRRLAENPTSPQRIAMRAGIVLDSAAGMTGVQIAGLRRVSEQTVCQWRRRFREEGVAGLRERPRPGRTRKITPETRDRILSAAVSNGPLPSCRSVAAELGVSHDTVHRVWRENDIRPHLLKTFKLSNDARFEEKFWDVVALYLDPPEQAIVLCCDEKSQCQALERTQPGLPLGVGHIRTRTHDYYRHGTITLFAALDYLAGKVLSRTELRHRHQEWLRFLKQIHREYPKELDIHLILDNYATHKHPKVREWLDKHPRFHLHFTPTSASWLNLVERFFRDVSEKAIRNGSFRSVTELTDSILRFLAEHNARPKRYVWRADPREVLERIGRARQRLAPLIS